jgi:hypothetical protein
MKKARIFTSLLLASLLVLSQVAVAFAAPKLQGAGSIAGTVESVTLETDTNTGVTTVLVEIIGANGQTQNVRISLETAQSPALGLVTLDAEGNPVIVNPLPSYIEVDPTTVIPDEQPRHPIASALATFFSDISGLDYNTIMEAHSNGNGFGVIVQALFLTEKLGGDATIFQEILQAKKDNDFSNFPLDDGTIPRSWGQLRKAIAEKHLGTVISHNNGNNGNNDNANNDNGNENSNQDKNKDKSNNANGNGNGSGNGNGNGNGKGNGNHPKP